jgi:hypothetical protein
LPARSAVSKRKFIALRAIKLIISVISVPFVVQKTFPQTNPYFALSGQSGYKAGWIEPR